MSQVGGTAARRDCRAKLQPITKLDSGGFALPAGRGYAAGVHYLHACPPHAFFARDRPLRAGARLGGRRAAVCRQPCALRGDYDSGFCALSAVLRVCEGAGAKALAPKARAAKIAVFIVFLAVYYHLVRSKKQYKADASTRGTSCLVQ